jgi:hypothetical protein
VHEEMIVWSRILPAVARTIRRCSWVVSVVGLRLAIADRRVEVGEKVKRELQFDLFCTIANAQNRAMDDGGLFSLDRTISDRNRRTI